MSSEVTAAIDKLALNNNVTPDGTLIDLTQEEGDLLKVIPIPSSEYHQ